MPQCKLKAENTIGDDHSPFEFSQLKNEIHTLKRNERNIRREKITLKMELDTAHNERDKYRKKYFEIKNKLNKMHSTPNLVATVEKIIGVNDNRAIIRLISGQMFVCKFDPNIEIQEGDIVSLHQKSMNIIEKLPSLIDKQITAMELIDKPTETYEDIGGLKEEIIKVREIIELSLLEPEAFKIFNIKPPLGVLLYGKPGTGKTLIAKACANATEAKFYYLSAPELVQKYIGEGARLVRDLFKKAREKLSPVIIFIDEIDAIAVKRESDTLSGEREVNRTLMQILAEMDSFSSNNNIRIIAATNRIDILDPAILRPGRFDRVINLPLPDTYARFEILKLHMKNMPKSKINIKELVNLTDSLTGADIKAICTEAAMLALRDRLEGKIRDKLTQKDFLDAIQNFKKNREYSNQQTGEGLELYA